jgi:hypothetical protein
MAKRQTSKNVTRDEFFRAGVDACTVCSSTAQGRLRSRRARHAWRRSGAHAGRTFSSEQTFEVFNLVAEGVDLTLERQTRVGYRVVGVVKLLLQELFHPVSRTSHSAMHQLLQDL